MEVFITRSKYVAETISVFADFSLVFPSGVTITGLPVVTITMDWGTDPTPSNTLYEGVSISNGLVVEQRIRLGIPGNIYRITTSTTASDGNIYEISTSLAILPNDGNATPTWLPLWETTQLYPYEAGPDSLQGFSLLQHGRFVQSAYFIPNEDIQGGFLPVSGILRQAGVFYDVPAEGIQGSSILFSGSMIPSNVVSYTIPYEGIKGSTVLISGTFTGHGIAYSSGPDSIQGYSILISGTLA